jgi:hypothetical protein
VNSFTVSSFSFSFLFRFFASFSNFSLFLWYETAAMGYGGNEWNFGALSVCSEDKNLRVLVPGFLYFCG